MEIDMELQINGLVVTIYKVGQFWKVVHCTRIGQRFGKSVVKTFAFEENAIVYAKSV